MKKIFLMMLYIFLVSVCASCAFASDNIDNITIDESNPVLDNNDISIHADSHVSVSDDKNVPLEKVDSVNITDIMKNSSMPKPDHTINISDLNINDIIKNNSQNTVPPLNSTHYNTNTCTANVKVIGEKQVPEEHIDSINASDIMKNSSIPKKNSTWQLDESIINELINELRNNKSMM